MKAVALIFDLIGATWSLIFKIAIVIVVIVGIWSFVNSCAANATLNEHSSCKQFDQADATTQDKVLQDMMASHNSQDGISIARFSVTLYCDTHNENSPIDGIYNSSNVDKQPANAVMAGNIRHRFDEM